MKYSKFKIAREAIKHEGFLQKLPIIIRMLKSIFSKGGYKPGKKNLFVPGLILLYLISPIDVLPDWIPLIGIADDLALLAFAIPFLMKEADRFEEWENDKNPDLKIKEAEIVE
ncbi:MULTISPECIES: YkvA family protein [Amniculibacterium]|jgi:uncharacterized membrane protein YkvA (DUF1232 family)|uniref:YkvA family protein n=1 Tax=Amniculibacterium TaxID=2715289 RepID=UPI000F5918F0|nr:MULTISPECIES: DUF1232 domain-containing protein [Amniculibacterium]